VKNSFEIDDIPELLLYTHVIPAKAGIQSATLLDTRLRGYDDDADVSESFWLNIMLEVLLKKRISAIRYK
jgi:hypothetical protein